MSDYKRNPRGARRARKSMGRKALVVLSLMMVLAVAAVGGTLAWLTDSTQEVKNTFTTSDIEITLTESENLDLKMVPGFTITKDPKVTVKAGSEACWLFVKVEKSDNLDSFISYTVDSSWTALDGVTGVYYREVAATTADTDFPVLTSNQVTVKKEVTKSQMEALKAENAVQPTLTFTAYATQLYKNNTTKFTAAEAWEILNPTTPDTDPPT